MADLAVCSTCGATSQPNGNALLSCAGACRVLYCSKKCQRKSWPTHKLSCVTYQSNTCWMCHETGPVMDDDDDGDQQQDPVYRACSCRGADGFGHLKCFVKHAMEHKDDENFNIAGCMKCFTEYRGEVQKAIFEENIKVTVSSSSSGKQCTPQDEDDSKKPLVKKNKVDGAEDEKSEAIANSGSAIGPSSSAEEVDDSLHHHTSNITLLADQLVAALDPADPFERGRQVLVRFQQSGGSANEALSVLSHMWGNKAEDESSSIELMMELMKLTVGACPTNQRVWVQEPALAVGSRWELSDHKGDLTGIVTIIAHDVNQRTKVVHLEVSGVTSKSMAVPPFYFQHLPVYLPFVAGSLGAPLPGRVTGLYPKGLEMWRERRDQEGSYASCFEPFVDNMRTAMAAVNADVPGNENLFRREE